MKWYIAKAVQGLVCDETTGVTVAVTYDKAHTPIVAAAPDLLEALQNLLSVDDELLYPAAVQQARAAIDKAQEAHHDEIPANS